MLRETTADGRKMAYRYLSDGGKEETYLSNNGHGRLYYYNADGQLVASKGLE